MSDEFNILPEDEAAEVEKLMNLTSGLKVPPSSMSKDEAWSKLMSGIEKQEKAKRFPGKLMLWSAAAIILIAVVSGVLEYHFATQSFEAPAGNLAYGMLPDSSFVTLNAETVIKHREFGFNKDRTVELTGEAFFDVKKGKSDFVVIAGENKIRVVGTQFNVYFRSSELSVECLTGKVQVQSDSKVDKTLSAGQGIKVNAKLSKVQEFEVDEEKSASWLRGEHFFTDTQLADVFIELERQFGIKIEIRGFNPEGRLYTGYFTTNNLEGALNLVCVPMGLNYKIDQSKKIVIISAE